MSKKSRRGWPWASRSGRGRRFVRPRRDARPSGAGLRQADRPAYALSGSCSTALIEAEHDDGVFPS